MAALGPDGSRLSLLATAAAGELGNACVGNPLPKAFFARPAEVGAPELIGCLLVKRQSSGGVAVGCDCGYGGVFQRSRRLQNHCGKSSRSSIFLYKTELFLVYLQSKMPRVLSVLLYRIE